MTWRGMALPVRCEEPGWVSGRATAPDRPGADLTGGRDGAESEPGATCPVGGADPRQEWTVTPTGAELAELCKLPVRPGFWKRWKEAVPGRWRARLCGVRMVCDPRRCGRRERMSPIARSLPEPESGWGSWRPGETGKTPR